MAILENIDIDKGILLNIDIDKVSYRLGFGISNTPNHQATQEPVIVEHGAPPEWLSGTLARHACGVYGETGE